MTIQLSPEDEQIIREHLAAGRFHSAEEAVHHALVADREANCKQPGKRATTLSEFFLQSPLVGSDLDLERDKGTGRGISL